MEMLEDPQTFLSLDCEQSLSFPSVLRDNKITRDRTAKRAARSVGMEEKGKRKRLRRSFLPFRFAAFHLFD